MNPRVSPASKAKAFLAGKNGVSRNLNTQSGSAVVSHIKRGEGSIPMNYDPKNLDIVSTAPSAKSTKPAGLNPSQVKSSRSTDVTPSESKLSTPVISTNSSRVEVTYNDAEAILVTSGKNWTHLGRFNEESSQNDISYLKTTDQRRESQRVSKSEVPAKGKGEPIVSHSTASNGNSLNEAGSEGMQSRELSVPHGLVGEHKNSPAVRSHSFHSNVGDTSRPKVKQRSQSVSSADQVQHTDASRRQSVSNNSLSGQKNHLSRLDSHITSLRLVSLSTPATLLTSSAAIGAAPCTASSVAAATSRPVISTSSSSRKDASHGFSVRFADVPVNSSESENYPNHFDTRSLNCTNRLPAYSANDSGIDAARRLCSNSTRKKIYIDTVKKEPLNGSEGAHLEQTNDPVCMFNAAILFSHRDSQATFHHRAMEQWRGEKGLEESNPDSGFHTDFSFQQSLMAFTPQQTPPLSSSSPAYQRRVNKAASFGNAGGLGKGSPSSSLSPSASFTDTANHKPIDHQKQHCEIVSKQSAAYNNSCNNNSSYSLYSLTPSSSLSSTSSSLSKDTANAPGGNLPGGASAVSPSTPSIALPQSHQRSKAPSGLYPDEAPFSLLLTSSSSSSSLLLPISSPSASPTLLVTPPSSSSSSSTSNTCVVTSISQMPSSSIAPTRLSSACLRKDCVLPGVSLHTISNLDYLLSPTARTRRFPTSLESTKSPVLNVNSYNRTISSPEIKPKFFNEHAVSTDSPSSSSFSSRKGSQPFPCLLSPSAKDPVPLCFRKSLLTPSTSSSDVGSSISSSATSLSCGKPLPFYQLSPHLHHLSQLSSRSSPLSSPSLSSKTASDSRASLASLIKKESIAASYQLEYCWFCGRPMPPFGTSLSGGEEHLEKLAELEKLLAQAQSEKVKLVEEQVRIRESEMLALQKNEVLERELQQVKLRERHTQMQARPMTRFLPNTSRDFDLRAHIEGAGHLLDACPHVIITTHSCRGWLHKMGGRIKTWKKRWFVFDRMKRKVFYFTDKSELKLKGSVCFQAIEEVYADHLKTVKSPSPKLTFCMKTFDRTYFLVAPSPETMTIWIDVLFSGAEGYQQFYDS
ncbi:pleckstrin homology-like domain family b member 2 [Plakobranchus ocellatus]|uniref:Pleckstrin homology-like domain family b member 2 n=1 Tax=Plakobranchus ocellatus TaxID=259542 RepID=A0AAV4DRL7_9GAST|nr:pleckstrin homology-like domain family b member 2 [Plakobranchus ocellatus]